MNPLPDLQVTRIETSQAIAGQTIEVSWTISNTGSGDTSVPAWYDRVWISPDIDVWKPNPEDVLLGEFPNLTYLGAGESYIQTQQISLPDDVKGIYYLFVVTDNYDAYNVDQETMEASTHSGSKVNLVPETNNNNNIKFTETDIAPPPASDLSVTSMAATAFQPFEMYINAPSATRVGQNFAYMIEYANLSNNDMVSPFLVLGGEPHFERDLPTYSELAGDTHKIRAVSNDGPAYILRPGSKGSVSVKAQSPDTPGTFLTGAIAVHTEAPKWATQDLFIFKSIRINSEGKEVELIDKVIAKALSQTEPGITFPGGAKFIPTSAIDGRALDIDNYLLQNTEVIPGILESEGDYFFSVLTSSDLNMEAETIGISDALDIDLTNIFPEDVKIGDIGSMNYTFFQFLMPENSEIEYGSNALQIAKQISDLGLIYSLHGVNFTETFHDSTYIVGEGSQTLRASVKQIRIEEIRPDGTIIVTTKPDYQAIENNEKGDKDKDPDRGYNQASTGKIVIPIQINFDMGKIFKPFKGFGKGVEYIGKGIGDICGAIARAIDNYFSKDPNDITGPKGYGENHWISASQNMLYTIRFENDPELATAPAQVVSIRQTLDSDLDPRTFRLGSFGFGEHVFNVPENTSYYSDRLDLTESIGIYVDVTAGIDINTNEAFWILRSVDPTTGQAPTDPFAGFLPVNDPETHVGEGFVNYTIRAKETAVTGDVIDAQARIIFDINDPIDTPPIFNTIDADIPASQLKNRIQSVNQTTFTLNRTAEDAEGGSGLQDVTLYMATDDQPFQVYEENLTDTALTVTLSPGHDYRFFTIAKDNAGNTELMKTEAEVTVRLSSLLPSADAGMDQQFDEGDTVTLDGSASSQPGGKIVSYQWTQTAGTPIMLSDAVAIKPTFIAPDVESNEEYLVFQLNITDNQGLQNTSHCLIYLTDAVFDDTDGDGMADNWETEYFGTLDKNGTGDEDNDGISDLDEYENGTDPLTETPGDINQDKEIDLLDALIALQIISGGDLDSVFRKAADISRDGKIGIEEAIYVLQHIVE